MSESTKTQQNMTGDAGGQQPVRRRRRSGETMMLMAHGEPLVWLSGGALALCVVMIVGLLLIVFRFGVSTFWPGDLQHVTSYDGTVLMGEVFRRESFQITEAMVEMAPEALRAKAQAMLEGDQPARRTLLRTGNFDLTNTHFHWVDDFAISDRQLPQWAALLEREEWGRFYGIPVSFSIDGEVVASTAEEAWGLFTTHHPDVRARQKKRRYIERVQIGRVNAELNAARLRLRGVELRMGKDSDEYKAEWPKYNAIEADVSKRYAGYQEEIKRLNDESDRYKILFVSAQGVEKQIGLGEVVRGFTPNRLSFSDRVAVYLSRWLEFVWENPREANQEGGVFPAIFGTVLMTMIMTVVVVPFGVMAALYLREYAKSGPIISAIRIAINNLAGVPSIVFGVFGLGFFCYIIGASIDDLLFSERLPSPTFGTGGLLWASLTLALLTLPVVIVATEEALAAVPNSMREGSYACGASKWQTILRIVLPRAMPGIMTGAILAIARGAGEVAPLMLVGAVKLAPELPGEINLIAPYIHVERSFMHLGFHIFDVGFQSPNAEAAKPMVYTTTLLLIVIIAALNIVAITLRDRLRRKFVANQF